MKKAANPSVRFVRVIRSEKDEAEKLIHEALDYFRSLQKSGMASGISEFNFRLALDETIENAVSHGNSNDPEKTISITILGFSNMIEMSIVDEGTGFKPEKDPHKAVVKDFFAAHGRGLCLLQNIGRVSWNKKGNCITVELVE